MPRKLGRTFVTYAAIGLVPVIVLGIVLAVDYGSVARQRGIAEAARKHCSLPRRPWSRSSTDAP